MKAESLSGNPERYLKPLDTFNIIMVYVGPYEEELPEISAVPAALFSPMDEKIRKKVVMNKFKIDLDDKILGRIGDMITLDDEAYNHGFREGKAEATKQILVSSLVLMVKEKGMTLEEASSNLTIPEDLRSEIMDSARHLLD